MEKFIDSIYNNKSSKIVKIRSPNGNVSPLMMKYLSSSSGSGSSVDPFSPPSIMSKYKCSSSSSSNSKSISPLSALDDEDVLVMDGILVSSSGSSSNSSTNTGFYKTGLCRSWEDFGKCRFNNKCQFAHGKEDLRPTRFPINKNKSEAQNCKSSITGSSTYGSKCRFVQQVMPDAAMMKAQTTPPIKPQQAIKTPNTITTGPEYTPKTPVTPTTLTFDQTNNTPSTTIKPEQTSKTPTPITNTVQTSETPITTIPSKDYWSPLDDGIEVSSPFHCDKAPTRQEVESYIQSVVYCPTPRKRLPVFTEICPD